MIDRLRTMVTGAKPSIYAVLDIGSVDAKALLVIVEGDKAGIVGAFPDQQNQAQAAVLLGGRQRLIETQ